MIAEIVIFNGPPQPLSYRIDPEFEQRPAEGQRVIVPLGSRKAFGIIYDLKDEHNHKLKAISEIIDRKPLIDKAQLALLKWICGYYNASPRDSFGLFLPKAHTAPAALTIYALIAKEDLDNLMDLDPEEKEILGYIASRKKIKLSTAKAKFKVKKFHTIISQLESSGHIKIGHRPLKGLKKKPPDEEKLRIESQELMLNSEQQVAYDNIAATLKEGRFRPFLLFGVTGSGKSELYLKLIWDAVGEGKTVLLLLPEIVSAEELYHKVKSRLGDMVCRIHSGLTPSARFLIWEQIRSGKYKVVIGPRSALFTPLAKIGLIIVDEEHDSSYKQSGTPPYYHGRDLALMLARNLSCPVILGSATPSVESWYNASVGKYKLLRLRSRWDSRALPSIQPVEFVFTATGSSLSEELLQKINAALKEGGQIMLLLNRRGFAPTVKCGECGYTMSCPNCSVGLVFHKSLNTLRCHTCDYQTGGSDICPRCSGNSFLYFGVGTQKLEEEIQIAFPKIPYARIDLDTAAERKQLPLTLERFRQGKTKILIGTQMIAKAFDFPQVALMGVLSADSYLEFPDFRSREKTMALLLQASGRAGRGKYPGEVVIQHSQTYKEFIENLSEDRVEEFLQYELKAREALRFPPYKHLILIHLKSPSLANGERAVNSLSEIFQQYHKNYQGIMELLGPSQAPLFKIRNNYRWQFLVKTKSVMKSLEIIRYMLSAGTAKKPLSNLRVSVDVDPVDML
jgi:primosomal protein N' (replication factor Y)